MHVKKHATYHSKKLDRQKPSLNQVHYQKSRARFFVRLSRLIGRLLLVLENVVGGFVIRPRATSPFTVLAPIVLKKVVCEMVSYYSSLRGGTCSCFLRGCTYARHGFVFPSRASFIDRNLILVLPHLQYTNYPFHCSIYSTYLGNVAGAN